MMPIVITGLKELRRELKDLEKSAPREVNKALKEGAKTVTTRANELAPQGKTGKLKADGRPFSTARAAGVRYTLVYAPVQEFAVNWVRHKKGAGDGTTLSKAAKRHVARGESSDGEVVHYIKNGPPPRFAFKAVEQLAEALMEDTFERLTKILKAKGWFKE